MTLARFEHDLGESYHGGVNHCELTALGLDPTQVIDLSSNILAVEHPASVARAIAKAMISHYPDRHCIRLRDVIGAQNRIDRERVLVGNGATELIHLVASSLLAPGDQVLVIGPTFSEYDRASRLAGGEVLEVRASAEANFAIPVQQVQQTLQKGINKATRAAAIDSDGDCQTSFAMAWICNPNNPTGQLIDADTLRHWIRSHPDTIFVVDESYIEFCAVAESLIADGSDNLIVIRSLTKSHALAGIRIGYLTASAEMMSRLIARRLPWSVSSVAQEAAIAALESPLVYTSAIGRMADQRATLVNELNSRGFAPVPTTTGFFLMRVDDAQAFRGRLLRSGVLIRDCRSFGLPDHVRIAVSNKQSNTALLSAIDGSDHLLSDEPRSSQSAADSPSVWDETFRGKLHQLFRMRRDVRKFRRDAIAPGAIARFIDAACVAPSVGLSQPWRFVSVNSPDIRRQVIADFESQNEQAAAQYDDSTGNEYRRLKLAGLREAPEHLAVFVDSDPDQGRGLGRQTMPETVAYSVVAAIQNFWLAARSEGVGVGWVSILNPDQIVQLLGVPSNWQLIAYLCVGYPEDKNQSVPELELRGWETRQEVSLQCK